MRSFYCHSWLTFLFLLLLSTRSFAQPANDICANAILVSVNGGPVNCDNTGTVTNGPNPTCGGNLIKDIWYKFVYNGGLITIVTALGTNNDTRIAVYGSCGGSQLACDDDSGPGNASMINISCTQLTIGNTYFIQAAGFNSIVGTFTLTVSSTGASGCNDPTAMNYTGTCVGVNDGSCQYNDVCTTAYPLTVNGGPLSTSNGFTVVNGPNPPCGGTGIKDVWFSFVYNGGEVDITTTLGTNTDTRLAVYDACGGNVIGCNDDSNGLASLVNFACGELTVGNTYYIQAGGYNSVVGTFTISVDAILGTCIPGMSCNTAFEAVLGVQTAPVPNTWYTFTPDVSGQWRISTCNLATCDTRIWIYEYCNMNNFDDSNIATFTYNDDFCGVQSEITPLLAAGETYYFRIGDTGSACGNDPIDFLLEYVGPVSGCLDINACNYSPIATMPAICYYGDDPNCNNLGPDLEVVGSDLFTSLVSTTINATDACLLAEGCIQGFGTRQVLRFTTHIKNVGNQDYFIGVPSADNPQFEWDQCHNHFHYEGYASYELFDPNGTLMPQIGFKNGFCVLDLECSGGGVAKYGCGNMGITAGCGDIYSSGLACQWIDITDVPAGDYFMVIKTNWDQSPDQAGHYELGYANNFAYVCIHFERDTNNNIINFTKNNTCPIPSDCLGFPFGTNVPDCLGNCPGIVKRGDLTGDLLLNEDDITNYMEASINGSVAASECSDLNLDGDISVADAVNLHICIHGQEEMGVLPGFITDCPWDSEIVNPFESTELGIAEVNTTLGYVDVYIINPDIEMLGLEFEVSGITISSVESLVDPSLWTPQIYFALGGTRVSVLSENDAGLPKYALPEAILRLWYSSYTSANVCVSNIIDAVDHNTHNTPTVIGNCLPVLIDLAQFSANSVNICQNQTVVFQDLSTGGTNSWTWSFPGGSPSSSNQQNPVVSYPTPGNYDVSLISGNGIITDSEVKAAFIAVNAATAWHPDGDGDGYGAASFELTCVQPTGYVADGSDCDDTRADVHPGAPGTAEGIDNNCNGLVQGDEAVPATCTGDFNSDSVINTTDLLLFMAAFGCTNNCAPYDISGDLIVNTSDLLIFMAAYGTVCP